MSTLRCIYDLRQCAITYDFGVYLALADCARQLLKRDTLDVTVRYGEYRNVTPRDKEMPEAEKFWRVRMLQDVGHLLPTISSFTVTNKDLGPFDFPVNYPENGTPYAARHITQFFERGADPKVFKAPEHAKKLAKALVPEHGKYVTMTLRQSNHFADRNVDLETWLKFSQFVTTKGIHVVVIPDQEDVLGEKRFYKHWFNAHYEAAMDLRLRFALYEGAMANFCSANGPTALLFFTHCPSTQFDQTRGGRYGPAHWYKFNGFGPGKQFPWSAPNQRMTWTDSTFENLVSEWNELKL